MRLRFYKVTFFFEAIGLHFMELSTASDTHRTSRALNETTLIPIPDMSGSAELRGDPNGHKSTLRSGLSNILYWMGAYTDFCSYEMDKACPQSVERESRRAGGCGLQEAGS